MQELVIKLKPSRVLLIILLLLHIGGIVCLFLTKIPFWLKIIGNILVIFSFAFCHYRHRYWTYLAWNKKLGWNVSHEAKQIPAQLMGSSLRSVWLMILNFRCDRYPWRISLILFPDTMHKVEFRRLQVFLLNDQWRKHENQYRY